MNSEYLKSKGNQVTITDLDNNIVSSLVMEKTFSIGSDYNNTICYVADIVQPNHASILSMAIDYYPDDVRFFSNRL